MTLSVVLLAFSAVTATPWAGGTGCDSTTTVLPVDLERSEIRWKGTKFWGLGSHEGTVRLKSGHVCVIANRIVGGEFVADMTSIAVTDIPQSDPVPRKRLRDHLLSDDFFHVAAHPEARLLVLEIVREQRSLHRVRARLTIREHTHEIAFYARVWSSSAQAVTAEARFAVDRHRWGVRYQGSTIRDDLVDDEFWLDLRLTAGATGR